MTIPNKDKTSQVQTLSIPETITGYLDTNLALSTLSQASIKNRRIELKRFSKFCADHKVFEPQNIFKNLIVQYIGSLKVQKNTKVTTLLILGSYMNYLVDQELVLDNIVSSIKKPKIYKKEMDYLTKPEIDDIFRKEAEITSKKFVDRNLLMFNLLFQLCVRATEMSNMKFKDVTLTGDHPEVYVSRKGDKDDFLPLNPDLVGLFYVWFDVRDSFNGAQDSDYVFISSRGSQITRKQIYSLVNQAVKRAGYIRKKMGPHLFRHSGASYLNLRGATPSEIQFLMGHSSLDSTQVYLHFNRDQLKDTVNRISTLS